MQSDKSFNFDVKRNKTSEKCLHMLSKAFYLFLLNVVWTLMAVGSYSNWKKLMKEGK